MDEGLKCSPSGESRTSLFLFGLVLGIVLLLQISLAPSQSWPFVEEGACIVNAMLLGRVLLRCGVDGGRDCKEEPLDFGAVSVEEGKDVLHLGKSCWQYPDSTGNSHRGADHAILYVKVPLIPPKNACGSMS